MQTCSTLLGFTRIRHAQNLLAVYQPASLLRLYLLWLFKSSQNLGQVICGFISHDWMLSLDYNFVKPM